MQLKDNFMTPHVHVPFEKVMDHIDLIREHRFNLEIFFNADTMDAMTGDDVRALKDALHYGPAVSFHAPFMDLSPGAADARIRKVTIERFNEILDVAEQLNPVSIVFHSGYEKWKYALKIDPWLQKSVETWKPVLDRAVGMGIKIAIENVFEDEPTNLMLLMEEMRSDSFGVCFDSGHFNLFSRIPLDEWIGMLKPYIIELHLHDNDKTADKHLPVGEGSFDFPALFGLIGDHDCIYTVEAHTPERALRSVRNLKNYL
ncbi:MAG TPA: sugar phosphate isomerase/epimerase family protein [Dissulfurispiraceae bacterium]|nr:sugar phosphate isomerase/epimerase family protein [Dissulfurispiraceae bacterium]